VAASLAERTAEAEKALSRFVREQEAILPLDQLRFLAAFEHGAILAAVDAYLAGLTAAQREAIVASQVAMYRPLIAGQEVTVEFFGMTETAARALVEQNGDVTVTALTEAAGTKKSTLTVQAGVVVTTADRGIKCRATLEEKVEAIMDTQNYTLAATLFGRRKGA
jgi:hypothetical protein